MKYKVGDEVRIKSLDWYNENKSKSHGTVACGCKYFDYDMREWCGKTMTILTAYQTCYIMQEDGAKDLWTDEMIEGLVEEETDLIPKFGEFSDNEPKDMGEVSDGYHTFNELYEYRMLYNAALFNEFAKQGLYDVHKSRKHSDGEYPFGNSKWFIVMAELPTGQISNHYEMKDWDLFDIPEKETANKWDRHTPKDVTERLRRFLTPKPKYPQTYEECCYVLEFENTELVFEDDYRSINPPKEQWKRLGLINQFNKLLICRDAYWKIAGEEMGLGKPWHPDWNSLEPKYVISISKNSVKLIWEQYYHRVFAFPTEEMRDAFYEVFKELIEECKELL